MVVWIEISVRRMAGQTRCVTTCVVVWIEIPTASIWYFTGIKSPPAWWCGLKFISFINQKRPQKVTTCVVVWIEICQPAYPFFRICVTTCVVVWIEMLKK